MITPEQLDQIGRLAAGQSDYEALLSQLRSRLPELHFTHCMDDDVVAATPVVEERGFNVYLVDGRNHCFCFTQELDLATGVVLAEIDDE